MNSMKRRNKVFILCVIVLLVILAIWLLLGEKGRGGRPEALPSVKQERKDTLAVSSARIRERLESKPAPAQTAPGGTTALKVPHGLTGSGANIDTSEEAGAARAGRRRAAARSDTAGAGAHALSALDTAGAGARALSSRDTSASARRAAACAGDTVPPWVYPDPSGGLHRHPVSVVFSATKPCVIEWKSDSAAPFAPYAGDTIRISATTTLYFRAHDSCGNSMEERQEYYELSLGDTAVYCPPDMEFVKAGETRFCIDHYEWPNKKNALPLSFISLYNAVDSCVSAGKRLCTTDEWVLACTGPYGWKYAYGNTYEPRACVSHDTTARPSGSKPECRGYFEVFDMDGNLAEWTNTRSDRNPQFYNVKGGFWESGPHTGCFDVRYSYYPQNRHNPVGFRCCKDAAPQ